METTSFFLIGCSSQKSLGKKMQIELIELFRFCFKCSEAVPLDGRNLTSTVTFSETVTCNHGQLQDSSV